VARVLDNLGVSRELTAQPGGIDERPRAPAEQIHAGRPVERTTSFQLAGGMQDLGFPLAAPLVALLARHEPRDEADESETPARNGWAGQSVLAKFRLGTDERQRYDTAAPLR
jgi:hypothetical protein